MAFHHFIFMFIDDSRALPAFDWSIFLSLMWLEKIIVPFPPGSAYIVAKLTIGFVQGSVVQS